MQQNDNLFARVRSRVDHAFSSWAERIADAPKRVIAFSLVACCLLIAQAGRVEITTNTDEFLLAHHPIRMAYDQFKDQFGSDKYVLITLRHDNLFSADFLDWLENFHRQIEDRVPYVEEVTSLVNARSTRGHGDELIVGDLLEDWPRDAASLARLAEWVASNPFYDRLVLGDDGKHTALQVELQPYAQSAEEAGTLDGFDGFDAQMETTSAAGAESDGPARSTMTGTQEGEVSAEIRAIIQELARPDIDIHLAGTPIMNVRIFEDVGRNLVLFVALSTLVVGIVMAFIFRRVAGVVLPLGVVLLSLAGMVGFVGLRGQPVNMSIQILPSFLLAVGCSSSIHLLVIFFQKFDAGASKRDAIIHTFGHAAMPVSLACMTTAVGLGSFFVAEIAPVKDIGFMAPVGIIIGLSLCLTLLPALLMVMPMPRRAVADAKDSPGRTASFVSQIGDFGYRRPKLVLIVVAAIALFSALGITRVNFNHNALNWFGKADPIHENTRITDQMMGGAASLELILDTGRENGLHEPEFQSALQLFEERVVHAFPEHVEIRKTVSVNGVLKEIHQALNGNDPAFYTTPDDRTLIAQELLLFENSGSDDLEKLVDSQFQTARVSLRTVWADGGEYRPLLDEVTALAREMFPNASVQATGAVPIIMTSLVETEEGMRKSYALALALITPLMILLIGSLRSGLLSMIPNLLPIVIVVGLMGWFGIAFDVFTVMTGSVAIGLAVDDTIHFLHGFYREFERTGNTRESIAHTLETTGQALLTTSIVLATGFGVFLFATMPTLQVFGFITTLAILLAFLSDILVAPALVTLSTRKQDRPAHNPSA